MEKEVWGKAAADSVGLMKFYESHKNQYKWGPSATAVFFTTTDPRTAEEARKQLSVEGLSNWHNLVDNSGGRILADSGRFDLTQIPITKGATANAGMMTPNLINDQDSTVTFTYIQKVYNDPAPRNFEDARGLVVNDYQALLEDKWIAELKKKYPVVVNQQVVNSLSK
jgi:peptidyl-prolyl cis-trans isomerase SurA